MEPYSITITGVNLADLANKAIAIARDLYVQTQQPAPQPEAPAASQPVQPQAPVAPAQPVQPQAPVAPAQPVAPAAPAAPIAVQPQYTLAQLQTATAPLMDAGKQAELQALLAQFGISALTGLPEVRYGEFATALRQLGAKL